MNLQTATVGATTVLGGFAELYDSLGELGAIDFDSAGVMWAVAEAVSRDGVRLASFAAGDLANAAGTDHGQFPETGSALLVEPPVPLAVEATFPGAPSPGPQLAATGEGVPLFALAAAAVAAVAGAFLVARSRRRPV